MEEVREVMVPQRAQRSVVSQLRVRDRDRDFLMKTRTYVSVKPHSPAYIHQFVRSDFSLHYLVSDGNINELIS